MGLPNTPALHHSITGPNSTFEGETMKHLIGSIPSWKLTVGRSMVDVNRFTLLALMTLTLLLAGCGTVQIRNPVPLSFQQEPKVLGRSDLRFWGDDIPPQIEEKLRTMTTAQIQSDFPAAVRPPAQLPGHIRRRFRRGLRRRAAGRLDRGGEPSAVSNGHGGQHRGTDCALCVSGDRLRPGFKKGLHNHFDQGHHA